MNAVSFASFSDETLSSGKGLNRKHMEGSKTIPQFTDQQIAAMSGEQRRQYFDLERLD